MIDGLNKAIEILTDEMKRTSYVDEECLIEDLIEILKEELKEQIKKRSFKQ